MGQAKARGTRDQRVAEAVTRKALERAERAERERKEAADAAAAAEREAAKKAAMTPVQRRRYEGQMRNKREMLAFALGAALAMTEREA